MNAHDSEKVIGTLEHEGYTQVSDETEAGLILYNTCSIRDKAEQKVFHRLNEYKRMQGEGKRFAVIGCVAQQEGERIFERAPMSPSWPVRRRTVTCLICLRDSKQGEAYYGARRPANRRDLRYRVYGSIQPSPRLHHHHRGLR